MCRNNNNRSNDNGRVEVLLPPIETLEGWRTPRESSIPACFQRSCRPLLLLLLLVEPLSSSESGSTTVIVVVVVAERVDAQVSHLA